jgi:hypothetical protein
MGDVAEAATCSTFLVGQGLVVSGLAFATILVTASLQDKSETEGAGSVVRQNNSSILRCRVFFEEAVPWSDAR